MKKKILIGLSIAVVILLVVKGLEWWLERSFQSTLNANPNRGYNITYADFDLHAFFKGVTLNDVRISPINPSGAVIRGAVTKANIDGLKWTQLLFGKRLSLREIAFVAPVFNITLSTDTTKTRGSSSGMQKLFGDILSRADLSVFRLENGSVLLTDPETGNSLGQVQNISIVATDLVTDSLHFSHIIPFEMGNMKVSVDSLFWALNNHADLSFGQFEFSLVDEVFSLQNASLGYTVSWVEVSRKMGVQKDVIEFNLDELSIHGLKNTSTLYSQLDVIASKVKVDGLDIKFQKNKNYNRPPDKYMPMFQGLIDAIPVNLQVDTIEIINSQLTYKELGKQKRQSGQIKITNIDGLVLGLTNVKEQQDKLGQVQTNLSAKLFGRADLDVGLTIPYNEETFEMTIDVGTLPTKYANPTMVPLVGVEFTSGTINRIQYSLNAGPRTGQNKLIFDYENLRLSVLNYDEAGKAKKQGFLSGLANAAIRPNNLPGDKKYIVATYQTERNVHRAPVNYFIRGLMVGAMHIVPAKTFRGFLLKDKKTSKAK